MTVKEFLVAFLGKTLNLPAEKVASLLNDEGTEVKSDTLETLLTADATRVKAFKDENQKYFDNGVKKATKDVLTDLEKQLKEQYGVTSDKQGTELIAEIVAAKTNAAGLDEAKVKLHPLYLELEGKMKTAVSETEKTWKSKYDNFEKQVAQEKTFSGVLKKADEILKGFALPDNEQHRENQKGFFVSKLKEHGFQINGEDIIVLDKDGKPVEDGHGNKKGFDVIVKDLAAGFWPVLEGTGKSGTGGKNDKGGNGNPGTGWKGKVPANDAEFSAALSAAKDATERIAITDAYDAANGRGAK